MFAYALHALRAQTALWGPALACALLPAAFVTLAATVFAPSTVAVLITGNLRLGVALLPGALGHASTLLVVIIGAGIAGLAWVTWSRMYSVLLWLSDEGNTNGLRAGWRATRATWFRVALLYARMYALLGIALIALALPIGTVGATGLGGGALLTAGLLLLVLRTLLRVVLTLAVRTVVFDDAPAGRAWRDGRSLARERARDVVAAWILLVSLGLIVWQGGRLITPALQDTAFAFPHDSVYTALREAAQLLVAIPLEGFLLALSAAIWTGVYRGDEDRGTRPAVGRLPLVALVAVLGIALVGNALPTIAESRFNSAREAALDDAEEREIAPADAASTFTTHGTETARGITNYRVDAELTGEVLTWSTVIDYANTTAEDLRDLGVHVYPAAFEQDIGELPLATDLLAADYTAELRDGARSAEVELLGVRVAGTQVDAHLDGTALRVPLPSVVGPGGRARVVVELQATLPHWPERFGVWEERTLLGNWIPVVAQRRAGSWRLDDYGDVGDPFFASLANYDVTLDVDAGLQVVGSGVLVSNRSTASDRHAWRFVADGHRDAAFAISRVFRGLERRVGDAEIRSWYPADERAIGEANLEAAVDAVTFYSELFGEPLHNDIDVVEVGGYLGGMEYPGLVFVSSSRSPVEGLPLLPDLLGFARYHEAQARYAVGHEIAHQWWFASVGNDQVREPWLDEAFAEYSTRRWLFEREGNEESWAKTNLISDVESDDVIGLGIEDFSSNFAYSRAVYLAGSEILFDLRRVVGPDEFDALLREWFAARSGDIATVEEFVGFVRASGEDEGAALLERYGAG